MVKNASPHGHRKKQQDDHAPPVDPRWYAGARWASVVLTPAVGVAAYCGSTLHIDPLATGALGFVTGASIIVGFFGEKIQRSSSTKIGPRQIKITDRKAADKSGAKRIAKEGRAYTAQEVGEIIRHLAHPSYGHRHSVVDKRVKQITSKKKRVK